MDHKRIYLKLIWGRKGFLDMFRFYLVRSSFTALSPIHSDPYTFHSFQKVMLSFLETIHLRLFAALIGRLVERSIV